MTAFPFDCVSRIGPGDGPWGIESRLTGRMDDKELRWRTALGSETPGMELMEELNAGRFAADDPVVLVYLCAGEVEEVHPATSVSIRGDSIFLLYQGSTVASYRRRDVLFCTKTLISPFAN